MLRMGAEVIGIDASNKNINIAKLHAKKNNLDIKYLCSSPENFNTKIKFDDSTQYKFVFFGLSALISIWYANEKYTHYARSKIKKE